MADTADYTQSDTAVPPPAYRVYSKENFDDDWTEAPNVDLQSIEDGCGEVAIIKLTFNSGAILREGATSYADETPLDWAGHFVKVEIFGRNEDGTPNEDDILERWIGKAMLEEHETLGTNSDTADAVDQTILVRGLEHLLSEAIVRGSWVGSPDLVTPGDDKVAVRVDTPIVFNAPRNGPVPWDRNCSADVVAKWYPEGSDASDDVPNNQGDSGSGPSVFAEIGEDTLTWKIADALDYLVCLYGPELADGVRFRISMTEPTFDGPGDSSSSLSTALYQITMAPMRVEGKSLFQCLNELLRPERGLGWRLFYDDDTSEGTQGPIIHVFSIQATAVTLDDATLPAATGGGVIFLDNRRDASWQTRRDVADEYGTIIVRGEEMVSCFSISKVDGSLTKGWTTQEQTAYATPPDAGSTGDENYGEKVAKYRARSRAWSQFVLKDDWNLKAKNGENGGDPIIVNPKCSDDGTPDYTKAVSKSVFDRRFERFIPIKIDIPTGGAPDPKPQYQEPIAFIKENTDDTPVPWIDLVNNLNEKMPRVSHYQPLEDRPGFIIRTDPNHLLAGNEVEDPGSSDANTVDWQTMILTVAMRTGQCVTVKTTIEDFDPKRILYIDVEHAEFWSVLKGTVTSVKANGELVRQGDTHIERDDRKRLRSVRDMAKAWYGQGRKPLSLQFKSLTFQIADPDSPGTPVLLSLGRYVPQVVDGSLTVDVKTVITRRAFTFGDNVSRYETGFGARPDFSTVA